MPFLLIKRGRQNHERWVFPDSSDDEILFKTTQYKKSKRRDVTGWVAGAI